MINWRSIKDHGYPTDDNISYLTTDGKEISTTNINVIKNYNNGETKFIRWSGDENTCEYNECCSGETVFELYPTHWCPISELNLPV